MSGVAFDRLLYTDCRPSEGLGSGGGYQVQAQSEGTSAAQSRMAVSWLLYTAQARWVNEGRPVEDFPLGFAHAADAGFGTAQSKYLGKEVNGSRQGNYLTDCLLAEATKPYGVIRPAQLWCAPFWREEIWPSAVAPMLDDGLDVGPLDHDAIADWLRGSPRREPGLARLLTVLEDTDGPRVIIRADEPEAALYWIAAATILLPMADALAVSFRVFTSNIDDAPHRVVAVPRDLHPNLLPGSRPRAFIIDAATDETDELPPSARASFWVSQLADAEEPYDVVEAVELAADIGGGNDQEVSDARAAAMAVCDPDRPIGDVAAVGRWLHRAFGTRHDSAAQSIVSRLIEAKDVRVDDLRLLDQLAASERVAVDAGDLRTRLLHAELKLAAAGTGSPLEPLPRVKLGRTRRADSQSAVVSAMLLGSDEVLELLLCLAWRHGLELEMQSAVTERLRAFVTHLLQEPRDDVRVENWPLRPFITDEIHGQLRDVFLAGDEHTLHTVMPTVARYLAVRGNDFADPFTWEIEGCYIRSLPPEERITRTQSGIAQLSRAAEPLMAGYQASLVSWHAADPATALQIVDRIPAWFTLNETILDSATTELIYRAKKPDAAILGPIQSLYKRGALPDHPQLRRIANSAIAIDVFLTKLHKLPPNGSLDAFGGELQGLWEADDDVVALSIPEFVGIVHGSASARDLGLLILRFLHDRPSLLFAREWGRYLADRRSAHRTAACAFVWSLHESVALDTRRELAGQVEAAYQSMGGNGEGWRVSVSDYLCTEEERALFEQFLAGELSGRRRPRLFRRN